MINEAIVLAGGLGTRLRSMVEDIPKSMAPINDRPFLEYLFDYLISFGIHRIVLSVGYKAEVIQNHFGAKYRNADLVYVLEDTPLGTGGAVLLAMQQIKEDQVIVCNGDSLFLSDIKELSIFHNQHNGSVSLSLKHMNNFERYGTVELNEDDEIVAFNEKKKMEQGLINGGVYLFNTSALLDLCFPPKFSLERDYFEANIGQGEIYGINMEGYFLDIGIPQDYQKAFVDFPQLELFRS